MNPRSTAESYFRKVLRDSNEEPIRRVHAAERLLHSESDKAEAIKMMTDLLADEDIDDDFRWYIADILWIAE